MSGQARKLVLALGDAFRGLEAVELTVGDNACTDTTRVKSA